MRFCGNSQKSRAFVQVASALLLNLEGDYKQFLMQALASF